MGYMNCVWPEERTKTQGYNEHHRPLTTVIQLNSWVFFLLFLNFTIVQKPDVHPMQAVH